MKEAIKSFKETGPVEVDIKKVCSKFKKQRTRKGSSHVCSDTFISRWHDEYRLIDVANSMIRVKVTISKSDAISIIDKLSLEEERSTVFNHASTYRLK